MKSIHILASTMILACTYAHASGSGEVTREGKLTNLTDAYACRLADHFDKSKMITRVFVASAPVDPAKIGVSGDCDQIDTQLRKQRATFVTADIAGDGSIESISLDAPGLSTSGSTMDKPELTRNDDKHIEGSYRTKDEKKKTNGFGAYFDLKFALDIPAAPAN